MGHKQNVDFLPIGTGDVDLAQVEGSVAAEGADFHAPRSGGGVVEADTVGGRDSALSDERCVRVTVVGLDDGMTTGRASVRHSRG